MVAGKGRSASPEDEALRDVARKVAGCLEARGPGAGRPAGRQLFLAEEEARQGGPQGHRPRPRAPILHDALDRSRT
jgi:hypothetical protein